MQNEDEYAEFKWPYEASQTLVSAKNIQPPLCGADDMEPRFDVVAR